MTASRRAFLVGAGCTAVASRLRGAVRDPGDLPTRVTALPLTAVRLLPSKYATAVATNREYLLRLSVDRLLHNFLKYAGLPPKGEDQL